MTGIKITYGTVSDNMLIIESDIPKSYSYKFMLWGNDNTPLIKAITNLKK